MIEVLCEDCREAFPSNQTFVMNERVLAGESQSARFYRGTRGGLGGGGSYRQSYRYRDRTLCFDCVNARSDAIRKAKQRRLFTLFAIIGIAVTAYELSPTRPVTNNTAPPDAAQQLSSSPPMEADEVRSKPIIGADYAEDGDASLEPAGQPSDSNIAKPVDDAVSEPTTQERHQPEVIAASRFPAIDNAIQGALNSGSPAKWHKGVWNGYVVVSAVRIYQDQTCRTVVVTTISGGEQTQTAPRMWCRSGNRDTWQPAPEAEDRTRKF